MPLLFVVSILLLFVLVASSATLGLWPQAVAIGAALATEIAIYLLACIAAALRFARSLDPVALLILPWVIAVYHIAYGLGFLGGVLKFARRGSQAGAPGRVFTALTR